MGAYPRLLDLLERSRRRMEKEGGIPFDEACRSLGITKRVMASAKRRLKKKGNGQ